MPCPRCFARWRSSSTSSLETGPIASDCTAGRRCPNPGLCRRDRCARAELVVASAGVGRRIAEPPGGVSPVRVARSIEQYRGVGDVARCRGQAVGADGVMNVCTDPIAMPSEFCASAQ